MLEQAIVDAAALREAAIQSAEQAVVEQYSNQIKETVKQLLEQDELGGDLGADLGADLGGDLGLGGEEAAVPGAPTPENIAKDADVKQAKAAGGIAGQTLEAFYESLAEDIDENTVLEIELDHLDYDAARGTGKNKITPMREAKKLEEGAYAQCTKDKVCIAMSAKKCTAAIEQCKQEAMRQSAQQSESNKLEEGGSACMSDGDCERGEKCDSGQCTKTTSASDAIALDEEFLDELAETLTMDYKAQPDGGFANGQMRPTNAFHDTQMVQEIAAEIEEYAEKQKKKNDKLQKENKQLKKELSRFKVSNNKLVEAVGQIKEKFENVHLMNAKLFYINKALMDASLNERQRGQIVESINNVDTMEQAKIVFEALRSTVGPSVNRTPKSLSEAVNKRNSSSILLHSHKKEEKTNNTDDFTKRMRRLAGIE